MTKVFVTGLEFYGYHGVSEQERQIGHRLRLDIEADVTEEAHRTDNVAETVDYGALAQAAFELLTGESHHTLEHAIELAGTDLMVRFPRIERLTLRLAKIAPPVPLTIESIGIERTFVRSD